MINGVQANLRVTRISCHQNQLYFVNLPFFSLAVPLFLLQFAICQCTHASKCFDSVWGAAALEVEMLHIQPLLMCLKPRFHPGCSAWVGWTPLGIWDSFCCFKLLLRCQFHSCCHPDLGLGQVGSLWTKISAQPPSSEQSSLSGAEMATCSGHSRDRKIPLWMLELGLGVLLDYSWNCLSCFELVEGLGVPCAGESSASKMQFVVGGFNHPKKTRQLLVRPGCPPCFAFGHSATAARCWQHKPAFISPTVPALLICSS